MGMVQKLRMVTAVLMGLSVAVMYAGDIDRHDYSLPHFEQAESRVRGRKEVTYLVYMAADNDLHPFVRGDIQEMQRIGSNERINILVYLNTKYPGRPKVSRKLLIERGVIYQYGPDEVRDSGDPKTLVEACRWAHTQFPSDKFVLDLWDHGSGSLNRMLGRDMWGCCSSWWQMCSGCKDEGEDRAVCYDFTTGNFFTDAKLQWALDQVVRTMRSGKKIDILAFDACLMADVEIAYTVQNLVEYMVASQEVIPGTGFGYDKTLALLAKRTMSGREMAVAIVEAYRQEYGGKMDDYTLSAVDLSKLQPLIDSVNATGYWLATFLGREHGQQLKSALEWCNDPRRSAHFQEPSYVDMGDLWRHMSDKVVSMSLYPGNEKAQLNAAIAHTRTALKDCVIANVTGSVFAGVSGLSIYFPRRSIDNTYATLIWSRNIHWYNFLRNFFTVRAPEETSEVAEEVTA